MCTTADFASPETRFAQADLDSLACVPSSEHKIYTHHNLPNYPLFGGGVSLENCHQNARAISLLL